jgi:hypothetical protein
MSWFGLIFRLVFRALRQPALAVALLTVCWRFRERNWYRTFPFLPIPDRTYLRWRMYTAYGDYDAVPPVDDIARYALWSVND